MLTSAVDLWYEHASESRLVDYYRCRLETDAGDGSRALTEKEEETFRDLVVTFKPWVRSIASVLVRGSMDLTRAMREATNRGGDEPAAALVDVLEDSVVDCAGSARDAASAPQVVHTDCTPTPKTEAMREVLTDYNNLLHRTHIDIANLKKPEIVRKQGKDQEKPSSAAFTYLGRPSDNGAPEDE